MSAATALAPLSVRARPAEPTPRIDFLQVLAVVLVGIGVLGGVPSAVRVGVDVLLTVFGFAVATGVRHHRAQASGESDLPTGVFVARRVIRLLVVLLTVVVVTAVVIAVLASLRVPGFRDGGWAHVLAAAAAPSGLAARHAWLILLGAGLAAAAGWVGRVPRGTVVHVVGLVAVLAPALLGAGGALSAVALSLLTAVGIALVLVPGTGHPPRWEHRLLATPTVRYAAGLSWSLFCWLAPVLAVARALMPGAPGYAALTGVSALAAVAVATFELVEVPVWRVWFRPFGVGGPGSVLREGAGRRYAFLAIAAGLVLTLGIPQLRPSDAVVTATQAPDVRASGSHGSGSAKPHLSPSRAAASPSTGVPSTALPSPSAGSTNSPSPAPAGDTTQPAGAVVPSASWTHALQRSLAATRFPALHPAAAQVADDRPEEWYGCRYVGQAEAARCTFAATGAESRTVAVVGDAAAVGWLPAIRTLQRQGYTVHALDYDQCPAAQVEVRSRFEQNTGFALTCDQHRDWAVSQIQQLHPDLVVLADSTDSADRLQSQATGDAAVREWRTGLARMIERVRSAGARRVVMITPVPAGRTLDECGAAAGAAPGQCVSLLSRGWRALADADTQAVRAAGGSVVDVRDLLCDAAGSCPAFIGDIPVRADADLPTRSIVTALAPQLVPAVLGRRP